jgi:hypothetical protein
MTAGNVFNISRSPFEIRQSTARPMMRGNAENSVWPSVDLLVKILIRRLDLWNRAQPDLFRPTDALRTALSGSPYD